MLKIGFIGAGNMAQAMIQGWSSLDEVRQAVYSPHSAKAVAQKLGIEAVETAAELVQMSDLVVIATPPAQLAEVAAEIKPFLSGKVVISILGGVSLSKLAEQLGVDTLIIRALPNVNVAVQQGYTAMAVSATVDVEVKGAVFGLLTVLGRVDEFAEAQFGAVSALAGSGPAFVAGFIQALSAAGITAGIDAETAEQLAIQTAQGTLAKMTQDKLAPRELAEQVMTPGGSTAAGWQVMEDQNLVQLVSDVIQATMKKNAEFE
ncbi:MAG: pyrroline-5-carboxylate reductase [Lactobacillaceae bacterium]|jgi:pyrroline-5-carboxylate reductase|nr:pyrroline-5-carboxylate reductase [Lactobacillaceae bacterium]